MSTEYFLPCECGQEIRIMAGQAGQEVSCHCGRTIRVPTLRGLVRLKQVVKSSSSAPAWSPIRPVVVFFGAVAAGILIVIVWTFLATTDSSHGPAAALCLEREYRGEMQGSLEEMLFPDGKPIPFNKMTNIKPLTQRLWSRADVEADFVRYREDLRKSNSRAARQLKGMLVVVKTERCYQLFRSCATATAALEKQSTALLKHFRIYGAWIETNPEHRGSTWKEWELKVIREYDFKLGPGPKICVFFPGRERIYEADAKKLDLYFEPFERSQGKTALLEEFLQNALEDQKDF